MSTRYLIIVNREPGVGALAREAIDLLLVAGAFDLDPAVLFMGRGVLHLTRSRAHGDGEPRPLDALGTYGITRLYADASSLRHAHLDHAPLDPAATVVEGDAIGRLIAQSDVVLSA